MEPPNSTADASGASTAAGSEADQPTPGSPPAKCLYSCQKCRRVLFATEGLKPHDDQDSNPKSFAKKHFHVGTPDTKCTSWFLQEAAFFGDTSDSQGKVHCPGKNCRLTLGSYNWAGSQCSCGRWVTPAFHVLKSRVDEFNDTGRA